MASLLHDVGRGLLDLLVPVSCVGCDADAAWLCARCRAHLRAPPYDTVPSPPPPGMPRVRAVAPYEDVVRRLLLAHKEHGVLRLAGPLADSVAAGAAALVQPVGAGVLVVPVPSARAAVRARGHDATRRLAAAAVRRLPGATLAPVLHHGRRVSDQTGLDTRERRRNLRGALAVRPRSARWIGGRPVVLVDDLVTSGATLAEAARAMRAAGAHVLGAAVVAATRRRRAASAWTPQATLDRHERPGLASETEHDEAQEATWTSS